MTRNQKLAEMKRREAMLKARIKTIKESRKTVSENKTPTGLAYLIESELEKAEVVLAAKSVVDKLQKMAEDLAKINGDEIMPIMEPLKTAFGPQMAEAFQSIVSEKVTATVTAVTQAKDAISTEVGKFQNIIDGKGAGSDMGSMGADEMGFAGDEPANDMDDMDGLADASAPDVEVDAEVDSIDGDAMDDDAAFDADPLAGEPVGRAKKESAAPKGRKIAESKKDETKLDAAGKKKYSYLRDQGVDHDAAYDGAVEYSKKNSARFSKVTESQTDKAIVTTFKKLVREGLAPVKAARKIAEKLSIDYSDVVEVIRETGLGK